MPEPASVLLLHGNDEFAISAHIEKMCAGLGDPATAGMNIARFDGRQGLDLEAVNAAVNAAPFLAPRRVMVMVNPGTAYSIPETRQKFLALLENAPPTTSVILVEFETVKPAYWLMKWASASPGSEGSQSKPRAGIHLYTLPKQWEMPRWIEAEAKKLGGRIEPAAAARLAEMIADDPRLASQELIKLFTYANYSRPVTLLDVEQVSMVGTPGSIFDLVDALGMGDGKKAQHVLHQLLEKMGTNELWGMVIRQFRLLLQVRELMDAGQGIPGIEKTLGLHTFVAGKIFKQAGRFTLASLESIYRKLLEIEVDAKTSQMPLDLALDTLVIELASK